MTRILSSIPNMNYPTLPLKHKLVGKIHHCPQHNIYLKMIIKESLHLHHQTTKLVVRYVNPPSNHRL